MTQRNRHILQAFGLLVFLALIVGLVTALSRPGALPYRVSALNSPVPHAYFPTRIPADLKGTVQPEWVTYEIPGEGLTFKARRDWPVASGKPPTIKYSSVSIVFWGDHGSIVFGQLENPERLSLDEFAKTPATHSNGSPHDAKWLAADMSWYAHNTTSRGYQRLLITRDDGSSEGVTASINGVSLFTVLIAYDQRVLIARSDEGMTQEAKQHFWEVIDSLRFSPIP